MSAETRSPGDPHSDLLFAALAHRLGFVRREDLVRSLERWACDRSRPLPEILAESGAIAPRRRTLLDELLPEYLAQHDMDAERGLWAVCAAREDDLDLGRYAAPPTAKPPASKSPTSTPLTLGTFGSYPPPMLTMAYMPPAPSAGPPVAGRSRYRILRPHARGALGQVFVAQDEELNRQVALKEIQPAYAGHPDCRSRFLLEAEITGSLEHPGIVPVYGLGVYADGRPYYAMRFVRGESLHEAISRFHDADGPARDPSERALSLRGLLRRFVDVCNAVAYAHSRGILHRDLKPGNIMLGSYGETLVVDWGLAKTFDGAANADTAETPILPSGSGTQATMLGQVVGTPAFMSPEAAAGKVDQVGPASDVYSLGSTLYALLTGVPPYDGDHLSTILRKVRDNEFPPPRKVERDVPAPLEGVVVAAMALLPADRYASAAAMAQDVERWLADEPLRAYRDPPLDRARRWMRRHRPLVAGLTALLLSTAIGLGVGLWAVNREKQRTARERDTAEHNFLLARKAVDECFLLATEDPLLQQEKMRGVRQILLQKALPFYEGFRAWKPDSADIVAEVGNNHYRVARITSEIGQKTEAIRSYEQARAIYVGLVENHPGENYRLDLARIHNNLGLLYRETGRREEELAELTAALALRDRLVGKHPDVAEYQSDLAQTYNNLGVYQRDADNPREALANFDQARDILRRLVREHKEEPRYRVALAAALHNLGQLYAEHGPPERSLEAYREARALREALSREQPDVAGHRKDLASTLLNLEALLHVSDTAEAERCCVQARNLCAALTKEFPEVAEYRFELARSLDMLGVIRHDTDPVGAQSSHREAIALLEALEKQHPEEADYSGDLTGAYLNMGRCHLAGPKPEDALAWFDRVAPRIRRLSPAQQTRPNARQALRNAALGKAQTLSKLGRHAESLPNWDEAVRLDEPPDFEMRANRAAAYARAGRHADATAQAEALLVAKSAGRKLLYETACAFALAAKAAHADATKPMAWREGESSRLASRAVALLEQAREKHLFDAAPMREHVRKDEDLKFLHGREDFRAFLRRIVVPN